MNSSRLIVCCVLISMLGYASSVSGQNLVRNCEFEKRTSCPFGQGQINRCKYWNTPGNGSTDYVHACNNGNFSVPDNQWGFEDGRSGVGYTHIIVYYSSQSAYREYLQTRLACQLQAGQEYEVSFYVSNTENSRYAIDHIGAHFSHTPLVQNGTDIIEIGGIPHIGNPQGQVIDRIDGWWKIHGIYTAQGGEQYITIGNFYHNADLTIIEDNNYNGYYSSYYVEDVTVEGTEAIFDLGPDTTICSGDSITFDISNICEMANLSWEDGSTSLLRAISEPGTYSIQGEIGCSDFYDEVVISMPSDPSPFLPGDSVICPGKIVDIIPNGNFSGYTWQDGSTAVVYSTDTEGTFWLNVTDQYGCLYSDTIRIDALGEPMFDLGQDSLICLGTEIMLSPGIDSAFHSFNWSDGSNNTYLVVSDSGEYWVQVTNPCGELTDEVYISTYNCDDVLIAPNAFTPNADGKNDIFILKAENIYNFKMYIYDRWGTLIYESGSLNNGWNGEFKGSPAPVGTYVWLAVYDVGFGDVPSETKKSKGSFVLIR